MTCKCEHWQKCTECAPHFFDEDGNWKPSPPTKDQQIHDLRNLLTEALYALEYANDMTKPEGLSGCDCPICTVIRKIEMELGR